ncbi:DUF3667 domain-containing protein [Zhouia spongiae]|uniref:DUF3667 domain-containing protein n=1 Tax=Zhouia spongiae TaxID=2202721 RepID=A0ABY3YKH7_9FLAO|nr:DUF3667 domain-containing protein [Zhouia spongiae]UNY98171.1 DUF3667 domain-containing protein [Zhouia spongiae]
MSIICKNCGTEVVGNFCADCGQSADTQRLDIRYILHDIQLGLLYFDKGLFYTVKELFIRPGHTVREFIEGKRVNHFKPLSLVILLATFYALLVFLLDLSFIEANVENPSGNVIDYGFLNQWITQHYALVALGLIPVLSLGSYISFKNQGYNFMEHMVLNAYASSQRLLLHIALIPVIYILYGTTYYPWVSRVLLLLNFILICWCYSQYFNKQSKVKSILCTVLTGIIAYTILIGLFVFWIYLNSGSV